MEPNGNTPQMRAEIQMALVVDGDSYARIGTLMDAVQEAVDAAIKRQHVEARFDFTGFNTHPCKAAVMRQLVGPGEIDYAPPLSARSVD
jgi:hypothetical protein